MQSLPSVHLIGNVARGEGPWGHASLTRRPLFAQLSPAPRGMAWEGCIYTCHWDSLIRSSHPAPDPPTPPERQRSDPPVPRGRPSRINSSSVSLSLTHYYSPCSKSGWCIHTENFFLNESFFVKTCFECDTLHRWVMTGCMSHCVSYQLFDKS